MQELENIRNIRKSLWSILGIVIAFWAQRQLNSGYKADAIILYTSATIMFVWAINSQKISGQQANSSVVGYALFIVATMEAIFSLLYFSRNSGNIAWILHIASVVSIISSIYLLDNKNYAQSMGNEYTLTWRKICLLSIIIAIAVFARFYRFSSVPFGIWWDEGAYGLLAMKIIKDHDFRPVYIGWYYNGPTHFLYLVAASFKLFGVSIMASRGVSAIMGVATPIAAYLAGRELFDERYGFIIATIIAVSRWDVNWSRFGSYQIAVPLFEFMFLWLLIKSLKSNRITHWALSGLALGLGLNTYKAFFFFPIVICLFLLYNLFKNRSDIYRIRNGLAICCVVSIFVILPVLQFSIRDPDIFWARTHEASIFRDKTRSEALKAVIDNTKKHVLMFNYRGDNNGRHNLPGIPMLDDLSGALMILGLGLCLWRWEQPRFLLLPIWLAIMMLPGILSLDFEAPQSLRAIGSMPAAYMMVSVAITSVWEEWDRGMGKRYTQYFAILVAILLGYISYMNIDTYFNKQQQDLRVWYSFSAQETLVGNLIKAESDGSTDIYVTPYYYDNPTVRFIAYGIQIKRLNNGPNAFDIIRKNRRSIIIIEPSYGDLYNRARKKWPHARFKKHVAMMGEPILFYQVSINERGDDERK